MSSAANNQRTGIALLDTQTVTLPTLVFASPPHTDDPTTVDLRAYDLPSSDVSDRNQLAARWRADACLTVRVDELPTARVLALVAELARREVRQSPSRVERFDGSRRLIVKVASAVPARSLTALLRVRVRDTRAAVELLLPPKPSVSHARRR